MNSNHTFGKKKNKISTPLQVSSTENPTSRYEPKFEPTERDPGHEKVHGPY